MHCMVAVTGAPANIVIDGRMPRMWVPTAIAVSEKLDIYADLAKVDLSPMACKITPIYKSERPLGHTAVMRLENGKSRLQSCTARIGGLHVAFIIHQFT